PTLTPWAPASTSRASITPSSTASTSMVALSVSISAITSPDFTVSPGFTSHLARPPSSMVGDSAGIRTSVMPAPGSKDQSGRMRSPVADLLGGLDDLVDRGDRQGFEIGGVG